MYMYSVYSRPPCTTGVHVHVQRVQQAYRYSRHCARAAAGPRVLQAGVASSPAYRHGDAQAGWVSLFVDSGWCWWTHLEEPGRAHGPAPRDLLRLDSGPLQPPPTPFGEGLTTPRVPD
jgi:hypothetical protein